MVNSPKLEHLIVYTMSRTLNSFFEHTVSHKLTNFYFRFSTFFLTTAYQHNNKKLVINNGPVDIVCT